MVIYICNAFSLGMLGRDAQSASESGDWLKGFGPVRVRVPRPVEDPRALIRGYQDAMDGVLVVSAVGHADTAALFSQILGFPVECDRKTVRLSGHYASDDIALIGQYCGPRLPEGSTTLPEGAKIEWWTI